MTPHSEAEKYPGGDYPLQNVNTGGVAEWVKQVCSSASLRSLPAPQCPLSKTSRVHVLLQSSVRWWWMLHF